MTTRMPSSMSNCCGLSGEQSQLVTSLLLDNNNNNRARKVKAKPKEIVLDSIVVQKSGCRPPLLLLSSQNVVQLFHVIILIALTGFVSTHKVQTEDECLSSNILCYECDSRYDPNCADPFDFSILSTQQQYVDSSNQTTSGNISTTTNYGKQQQQQLNNDDIRQQLDSLQANNNYNVTNSIVKKLPNANVCHGCCVKITSKTPDGATYVKRTCTTNLQINYFMVGLVCMKESGDRGKMCFCETDYCNGQSSNRNFQSTNICCCLLILTFLYMITIQYYRGHHIQLNS